MRPSLTTLSKASRLPLNSKKANKNFYKGVGVTNVLRRKRIALVNRNTGEQLYDNKTGKELTWNKRMDGQLDESRMISFVVPPGLAETQLRPYVFTGTEADRGSPRPAPGYPNAPSGLPLASSSSTSPRKGSAGGMDGTFYTNILNTVLERRATRSEVEGDVRRVRAGSKAASAGRGGLSGLFKGRSTQ